MNYRYIVELFAKQRANNERYDIHAQINLIDGDRTDIRLSPFLINGNMAVMIYRPSGLSGLDAQGQILLDGAMILREDLSRYQVQQLETTLQEFIDAPIQSLRGWFQKHGGLCPFCKHPVQNNDFPYGLSCGLKWGFPIHLQNVQDWEDQRQQLQLFMEQIR